MKKKSFFIFLADGYKGGANTFLSHHMQYLVKKKQNVLLIDKDPKETFPKINRKIKTFKIDTFKEKHKKIIILKKILKSADKAEKYIVLTNFFIFIKYYWFFQKLRERKNRIILTIHSGVLAMNIKRLIGSLIFSIIYKNIDYLFFGSNSAKSWWKNHFPWMNINNSSVYYNGVKIYKKFKPKKIKKNFKISFVGRLEKENNPYFFVKIALEYLKKNRKVKFNIFGNGSLYKDLKFKYSSRDIIFHGWEEQKIFTILQI